MMHSIFYYDDYKGVLKQDPSSLTVTSIFMALLIAIKEYNDYRAGRKLYMYLTKRLGIQDSVGNDVLILLILEFF
ncbi:hypothetical protein BDA99DRAFT_495179 [Phascolomyces articulosus]|uniref:Uncharacterized protein n=1 Tax=Phascolomyces articulosus TaxID=60185 RepID=A0AAD5KQA8_9FUNG|nr:hypothetical protein BDA99DRAFT_495179 [Phascolomyces articulosus]